VTGWVTLFKSKRQSTVHETVSGNVNVAVHDHTCFKMSHGVERDAWYIDSAATSHMTHDKSFFKQLDTNAQGQVTVAGGGRLRVKGRGHGELVCIDNNGMPNSADVQDVLFVPDLDTNLLSVKRLIRKGLKVTFDQSGCKIIRNDGSVAATASATHAEDLYKLDKPEAALLTRKSESEECVHI